MQNRPENDSLLLDPLTAREKEILYCLKEGLSNRQIAERLYLSLETIKWYNRQIFSKLGVSSRTQAIAYFDAATRDSEPASQPAAYQSDLPVYLTSFIGRANDIQRVSQMVVEQRLVTLKGAAGAGKTRLALEVAHKIRGNFSDGAYFVDLVPLDNPAKIAEYVLESLDVPVMGSNAASSLRQFLASRQILLVLDNFEHIMDAGTSVHNWVVSCPRLHCLVTSREALNVTGEFEYPVDPLPIPQRDSLVQQDDPEYLASFDSISLFVNRARAVNPNIELTAQNAAQIAEICSLLDGLPLAIELAASRTKHFPVNTLRAQLTSRLNLLSDGPRDRHERQRTLRHAIAWSYDLLTGRDKKLFACCGIFVDDWSLDTLEVISQRVLDQEDCVDGITTLVNKSLIRVVDAHDEPRFRMLETLREFANEEIDRLDMRSQLESAHDDYYLRLTASAGKALHTRDENRWMARLAADHANIRAALIRYLSRADGALPALQMVGVLGWMWFHRSHFRDGRELTELCLQRDDPEFPVDVRAAAYNSGGYLAFAVGQHQQALERHTTALKLYRQINDEAMIAFTLNCMAAQLSAMGDASAALACTEEAADICTRTQNEVFYAITSVNYAVSLRQSGRHEEADAVLERAVPIARAHQVDTTLIYLLANLRTTPEEEERNLREAIAISERIQDRRIHTACLLMLAELALQQGQLDDASELAEQAYALNRRYDDWHGEIYASMLQSKMELLRHHCQAAARHAHDAAISASLREDIDLQVYAVSWYAYVQMTCGHLETFARLLGWVETTEKQFQMKSHSLTEAEMEAIAHALQDSENASQLKVYKAQGQSMSLAALLTH